MYLFSRLPTVFQTFLDTKRTRFWIFKILTSHCVCAWWLPRQIRRDLPLILPRADTEWLTQGYLADFVTKQELLLILPGFKLSILITISNWLSQWFTSTSKQMKFTHILRCNPRKKSLPWLLYGTHTFIKHYFLKHVSVSMT